jgi:hypothetical protein
MGADEQVREVIAEHVRHQIADGLNAAFDRLFPNGEPVTQEHVKALVARFRKDTEPTDRDRNRARAHRHERTFDSRHRQDLVEVQEQVRVFDQYLGDLYLVLTKSQHHMHLETDANVDNAASDMADLIMLGSINAATLEYGVVRAETSPEPGYYWLKRQRYYEQAATGGEADALPSNS